MIILFFIDVAKLNIHLRNLLASMDKSAFAGAAADKEKPRQ